MVALFVVETSCVNFSTSEICAIITGIVTMAPYLCVRNPCYISNGGQISYTIFDNDAKIVSIIM